MSTPWVATTDGLHAIGEPASAEFSGHEVNALTRAGDAWWALVDRHELWRHTGDSWQEVAADRDLRLNCLSAHGDDVLVGTSEARLFRLAADRLEPVKTFDDLPDRSEWFTPWGGPPDVRSIARSGAALFANVHVGGIMRSDDDGTTWRQTIEVGSDVHEVIASDGVIAAATAWGLALSNDLGEGWEFTEEGLHASYARAITIAGDVIVMSSSTGPRGGRAALYRRPLSGGAFEKLEKGLPDFFPDNIDTGCIASAEGRVAFATDDGKVFLSEDQGGSWAQVADGLGSARAVAFA
jgi:hypothetical protein